MEIINVKISDIKVSEYNPRKISKEDKKSLKESLETFGIVDPLILNENPVRKNILIGGHQRLKIWKSLGHKKIPCIYVNLNIELEKELNIRLNKNIGEFDFNILEKHFNSDSLVKWGFSPYQFEDITFIEDSPTINIEHTVSDLKNKEEAVMLEIPMSPTQKKEIMLTINQYKKNKDISNGAAMYEIICINNIL